MELLPEIAGEPARAPLAWANEAHLTKAQADDGNGIAGIGKRSELHREKGGLLGRLGVVGEELDGFAPGGFLNAVEFAEIEDGALEDTVIGEAPVFDDGPVEVFFAVFAAFVATQEHEGKEFARRQKSPQWGRSPLQRILRNDHLNISDLHVKEGRKNTVSPLNPRSRVRAGIAQRSRTSQSYFSARPLGSGTG